MTPTELDEWAEEARLASIERFLARGSMERHVFAVVTANPVTGEVLEEPKIALITDESGDKGAFLAKVQQALVRFHAVAVIFIEEFTLRGIRKLMCNYERRGLGEVWAADVLSAGGVMAYKKSESEAIGLLPVTH